MMIIEHQEKGSMIQQGRWKALKDEELRSIVGGTGEGEDPPPDYPGV